MNYVVNRGSVRIAGATYVQGQVLPEAALKALSQQDGERFLRTGRIVRTTFDAQASAPQRAKSRGPWTVNPEGLAQKDLHELHIMVRDIDPTYDLFRLTTPEQAAAQLSADWSEPLDVPITKARDRTAPGERPVPTTGVRPGGSVPMSEDARTALERARAKARGEN